ncbi:unnamed protein product [Knipowitschia caucasica]
MMMPVYPGAPWLPKFKGPDGDLKYGDWKEQIKGLLGSQDLPEARKVGILLGALAEEAKRQVAVLDADEKDQVAKIFVYLDSLYGDRTPIPVLRAQFFSCTQKAEETVQSFILRLRELYCRLKRLHREDSPSESALRDQLLLGLRDGPLSQALKVFARRNPEMEFSDLRQEAVLLASEYGRAEPEVTCSVISKQYTSPRLPQEPNWKEQLKREIMEDVKMQMKGITQEIVAELKPLLQTASPQPSHLIQPGLGSPHPDRTTTEMHKVGPFATGVRKQAI